MKKYPVSRCSLGIFFAMAFFIILGIVFSVWEIRYFIRAFQDGRVLRGFLLTPIITLIGLFGCVYLAVKDMPFSKFSVSQDGISERIGLNTYFHNWGEFVDCGILRMNENSTRKTLVDSTFWVFFSTYILSERDRVVFLRKTRKDLRRIAFFEYSEEILDEILPYLPEHFANSLKQQSEKLRNTGDGSLC